jgi:diguanylate cyclase (GGDEF)-like protein
MKPDQILDSLSQLANQKRPVTLVAIAFFSLVCLSLAGMQGWSVYKARAEQLAAADISTAASARALADHVGNTFSAVDALLADLAERLESGADNDELRLSRAMAQRLQRSPLLAELSVYDEYGVVTYSSGASVPERSLFAHSFYHAGDPGSSLFIGQPHKDAAGKQWLVPVTRRLNKPDGSYGGMALASMRLALFQDFSNELDVGAHGTIAVALENGTLLMSRPQADSAIGKDARRHPSLPLWHVPMRSSVADAAGQERRDGALYTYRHLPSYPLLVTVSRSNDDVLAGWSESAYLSTAGAAVLLLLQLWMGIRLYGQIALRDRLEKERRILQKLLVKKSRSLRQQALKDGLTGIANRRQLDTRMAREFNRAIRDGSMLALVILDVDHFKAYNDKYGHPAGDECLKFIAHSVNGGRRRRQDLAARMGGEEFAILLPNTGLRGAIAVAEAIRKSVAAQRLTHVDGAPHYVTVSCGVHALVPIEGTAPQELIEAADRALYLAKTSGRNRVRAEGPVPPSQSRRFSLVVNK